MPALILLAFALLLGLALERGDQLWQPVPGEAASDAPWLTASGGGERLYLRTRIVLPAAPARAFLQVVAAGAFDVYTNGQRMGGEVFAAPYTGEVFDLTRALRAGENVIGIAIRYDRRAGAAHAQPLLVLQAAPNARPSVWPTRWRAQNRLAKGSGAVEWHTAGYIDVDWPWAVPAAADPSEPVLWIGPTLTALKALSRDCWIWSDAPTAQAGVFVRRQPLDAAPVEDAWLGIDVDGGYRLRVNGVTVNATDGPGGRLDLYRIARYLKAGDNTLEVAVRDVASPGQVCLAGVIASASGLRPIAGDASWSVGHGGPAALTLPIAPPPAQSVAARDPSPPLGFELRRALRILAYAAAILALVTGTGMLFEAYCIWSGTGRADPWGRFAQPFAVGALILAAVQLAAADPRWAVAARALLQPSYLAAGAAVLLGWLAITALGCIGRAPRTAKE